MSDTNDRYIMLDTMVVAGIFALTKKGPGVEENKKEWKRAVIKFTSDISNKKIVVPPSVCFELMCWNKEWYEMVSVNPNNYSIFSYSSEPIKNEIMKVAAEFAYSCGENYGEKDDGKYKLKSMDPVTAAYSLKHNHYILTENEKDFPEKCFHIVSTEKLILSGKDRKKYRRFLYLLEPNQD
jgi:hypothetical protein